MRRPRIGDIINIPLDDGRYAYAQYVFFDQRMGPLIQVLNDIRDAPLSSFEVFDQAKPLFPPVITGLFAAIRVGLWEIVGRKDVVGFVYPKFLSTLWDGRTGKPSNWYVYDGEKDILLGRKVPEKYRSLEFLVVWDPHDVVARIMTGEYPYPYRELIENNEFTPRNR